MDEPIDASTFTTADITNGGTGGATTLTWSIANCGDDQSFKIETTAITGDGTIQPQIAALAFTDVTGNGNAASSATDNTVTFDSTSPANATGLSWSETTPHNGTTINPTWTASGSGDVASQNVIYYTNSGCSVAEGTNNSKGAVATTDAFTGTTGSTYYYEIVTTDNAGNTNTTTCSPAMEIDTTSPTDNTANLQFTDAVDGDGNDIAVTWTAFTDTNLSDHRIITYTNAGCTLGATDHGLTSSSTNSNSTIIDGLTDGTYYATVTAYDSAGNSTVSACSTDSIEIDSSAPTVTINQATSETINFCTFSAQADPTSTTPVEFKVVVNEVPAGLTAADFTQTGTATGVNFTLTDCVLSNTYKLSVTSVSTEGTIIPVLNAAVFTDIIGNNNQASTSTDNSVTYDSGPPTIVSFTSTTPGDGTYGIGTNIDIVATFSEAVTTSTSSLTLDSGGTASYLSGSGSTTVTYRYTVGAAESSSDLTVSSVTAGDAVDSGSNALDTSLPGGNNLADNQAIVIETTAPTLTSVNIVSDYANDEYAKEGSIVTLTFAADENLQANPTVTVDTKSATYSSGSGTGPWVYTYTMQAGDTEGVWPLLLILTILPVMLVLKSPL